MAFYGIPIEKKYPLDTEDDVRRAIAGFNKCQRLKRKILADNINDRLRTFDMMVTLSRDNDFLNYIEKRFIMDVIDKDNERVKNASQTIEEYNEDVFNNIIDFVSKTKDNETILNYITDIDERADRVTREKVTNDTELLLTLDVADNICKSLRYISLQYNVSKDYVNKLLDDLEELYVAYHGSFIFKRKILCINQYNTRCTDIKSQLNILIGKRTKDILNDKAPARTIGRMSRLIRKSEHNTESLLVNYLKDKQTELTEYFEMQRRYFYSGTDFHKPVMNMLNDPYSLYEVESEIRRHSFYNHMVNVLSKYPKLNLEISYSDIYRLQKRVDYIKQIAVENLKTITMVSINEGDVYIVTKKKNTELNTFYLISYNDLTCPSRECETNKPLKGIKLIFKDNVSNDNISTSLESCTKF